MDGAPEIGDTARRTRAVTRGDKPITELRTTVTRGDGTVAVDGTAVCYTVPLDGS